MAWIPRRARTIVPVWLLASALVAGCGSSSATSERPGEGRTTVPATAAATPATADGEPAPAPVRGPLVSVLDIGVGLYAVDRDTGEAREIAVDGISFVDRDRQPLVVGDAAYTLGYTALPEQSFSHEVGLVRVDLGTGDAEQLFVLGVDREDDDAAESVGFALVAVIGDGALVQRTPFGSDAEPGLDLLDLSTGDLLAELGTLVVEHTDADGTTCSGEVRDLTASGGMLYGTLAGRPVTVASGSGEVTPLVGWCTDPSWRLSALVDPATAAANAVTSTGAPLTLGQAADLLEFAEPSATDIVAADGVLWWMFVHTATLTADDGGDPTGAIFGAIVRFDPVDGALTLFPVGDAAGAFLDADATDGFVIETFQGELTAVGDAIWALDIGEDGTLLRLDPATGAVDTITIPLGDGPEGAPADTTSATLLRTDPEGLWLRVDRGVTTTADDGSRTIQSVAYLDRYEPDTGELVRSIRESDITGL